jgi:hypothetical protein
LPGVKWPGREVDDYPPSSAEVKNEWRYRPTSRDPIGLHGADLYLLTFQWKIMWKGSVVGFPESAKAECAGGGGNKGKRRTTCQERQVSGRDSNFLTSGHKFKVTNISGGRHTPRQM